MTHDAVKDVAVDAAKEYGLPRENIWCVGTAESHGEYQMFGYVKTGIRVDFI